MKRVSFVRRAFDVKEYFSGADSSSLLFCTDDLTSTKGCFAPSTSIPVPSDLSPPPPPPLTTGLCFLLFFLTRFELQLFDQWNLSRDDFQNFEYLARLSNRTIEFFFSCSFHTRSNDNFNVINFLQNFFFLCFWKGKKQAWLSELIQRDIFGSQHNFCINDSFFPLFFIRRLFLAKYFQNVFHEREREREDVLTRNQKVVFLLKGAMKFVYQFLRLSFLAAVYVFLSSKNFSKNFFPPLELPLRNWISLDASQIHVHRPETRMWDSLFREGEQRDSWAEFYKVVFVSRILIRSWF